MLKKGINTSSGFVMSVDIFFFHKSQNLLILITDTVSERVTFHPIAPPLHFNHSPLLLFYPKLLPEDVTNSYIEELGAQS